MAFEKSENDFVFLYLGRRIATIIIFYEQLLDFTKGLGILCEKLNP